MKALLTLLILSLFACGGTNDYLYETPVPKPASISNLKYQLESRVVMSGGTNYKPGEVIVEIDTIAKLVTISGTLNQVFYHQGTFACEIKDTILQTWNPRDNQFYPYTIKILSSPLVERGYAEFRINNSTLLIIEDLVPEAFDDEVQWKFNPI